MGSGFYILCIAKHWKYTAFLGSGLRGMQFNFLLKTTTALLNSHSFNLYGQIQDVAEGAPFCLYSSRILCNTTTGGRGTCQPTPSVWPVRRPVGRPSVWPA